MDWSHYYYASVFPLAATLRLLERFRHKKTEVGSQLRPHHWLENSMLSAVCSIERPVMRTNRLFGLTAFVGCHKPGR